MVSELRLQLEEAGRQRDAMEATFTAQVCCQLRKAALDAIAATHRADHHAYTLRCS